MRSRVYKITAAAAACMVLLSSLTSAQESAVKVQSHVHFTDPAAVSVAGILGEALSASREGRLRALPEWNDGALIRMFGPEVRDHHHRRDWYGEHAGKWLYAAAIAARQTSDEKLKFQLLKTADFLVGTQSSDGYLGVYAGDIRMTNADVMHKWSWDVWNLTLMTLGLLEVHQHFPEARYLEAATRIGALFLETFLDKKNDITLYGTRNGISATIALDAVVELYKKTNDPRYLELAENIVEKMERRDGVKLVSVALKGGDMESVGDGKAYQLLWNLTALTKLYEVSGKEDYLQAVRNAWQNIADHHLTIAGGPWGGVGKHLECFNRKNFWNPYGFIETCSTMSWIQLNKQLLRLTGEARYAQELEKAAYNALLGAQFANGTDWSYHSFSNGRKHVANFNDCCPSSGALALEELTSVIYARRAEGIALNLFSQSTGDLVLNSGNSVRIDQKTNYPFDGQIAVTLIPKRKENFPLFIRIPDWAAEATIHVNGTPVEQVNKEGTFVKVTRTWRANDQVSINFPMELKVHEKAERAPAPQGGPELYHVKWFALTRGPLVFSAHGLIEGKDRERSFQLPAESKGSHFSTVSPPDGFTGPAYRLNTREAEDMIFVPYYEADGRTLGQWRLTWIQNEMTGQN